MSDKAGLKWAILGALLVLLLGIVRRADQVYDMARLLAWGEMTRADVLGVHIRFVTSWRYRVEYRFTIDEMVYEEPLYRVRRTRDIGTAVSPKVWRRLKEAESLSILYLPDEPAVNMPVEDYPWNLLISLHQVATLLFLLWVFFIMALVGMMRWRSQEGSAAKEAFRQWAPIVVAPPYAWVAFEFLLQVLQLVTGMGDMGVIDRLLSLLSVVVSGVIPVSFAAALAKRTLLAGTKVICLLDDD